MELKYDAFNSSAKMPYLLIVLNGIEIRFCEREVRGMPLLIVLNGIEI